MYLKRSAKVGGQPPQKLNWQVPYHPTLPTYTKNVLVQRKQRLLSTSPFKYHSNIARIDHW